MHDTVKPHLNLSFDLTIPLALTGQDIEDIIVTAFEGGIGYWCRKADVIEGSALTREPHEATSEFLARALMVDGAIVLYDNEADDPETSEHQMTVAALVTGVQDWIRLRTKSQNRGVAIDDGRLDTGNIDAEDADLIVQYAVFGEVVYG